MAEHKKDLEKKTKPILDTLRSYQDLPPVSIFLYTWHEFHHSCLLNYAVDFHLQDKALAALAIEDKKRQYAAAEKYLEDVLQSALASSEWQQNIHFAFTSARSASPIKHLGNWDFLLTLVLFYLSLFVCAMTAYSQHCRKLLKSTHNDLCNLNRKNC